MDFYSMFFQSIDTTLGGKHKRLSPSKLEALKDDMAFRIALRTNVLKALNRYSFENLPETCNERVIKESLLYYASVCFFEHDGALVALPGGAGTHGVTLYGDYTHCWVYGRNGFVEEVPLYLEGEDEASFIARASDGTKAPKGRGVWFRENEIKAPFFDVALEYAVRMADTWRNLEVSSANATTPLIIAADDRKVEAIDMAVNKKYSHGRAIVFGVDFDPKNITMLPIQTAAEGIKAQSDLYEWLVNRYDGLCGMRTNNNTDKKERMSTVEVDAGNESAETGSDGLVEYIQHGLDQVNYRFGTSIRCVKREPEGEPDAQRSEDETFGTKGGSENV